MKTINKLIAQALCVTIYISAQAQITPHEAVKQMARGINIGNTLEPEFEGGWNNPALEESLFDDYKNAGFTSVRIPVRWDKHTQTAAPYTIDKTWLDRIEQVVDQGLARGLFITINAHHEDWIKDSRTYDSLKERFDSIWSQIAVRFKDKSDRLLFEIINEPSNVELNNSKANLTIAQVNELNARILSIIRKTNPTRLVVFSGNNWSGAWDLVKISVPDKNDPYLMAYYHSYDPYLFGLEGEGTYGSVTDINATKEIFTLVSKWSVDNNIPVILGEFGVKKVNKSNQPTDYNSRMLYYATVTEFALKYGIAFNVWDDGGWFAILDREKHTWNDIKDVLIYTWPESPNKFKLKLVNDTSVMLSWVNRSEKYDSIVVERRNTSSGPFEQIAVIFSDSTSFIDWSTLPKKTYYYRIRTTINDTINVYGYPATIKTLEASTSIKTASVKGNFYVGPNPATKFIEVSCNSGNKCNLEVFNLLGKLMAQHTIEGNLVLSTEDFNKGVYFFKLRNNTSDETFKVLIQ